MAEIGLLAILRTLWFEYFDFIAMEEDFASSSESEYMPGDSDNESSDDSEYESDFDDDSDNEAWGMNDEPITDEGWSFMSDIFADSRPDAVPDFTGGDECGEVSADVPRFLVSGDHYEYFVYFIISCIIV